MLTFLLAGSVNVGAWVFKMLGFRYDKVSKVSPIFYTESVIGLFLDFFAFKQKFSKTSGAGIALVFGMFGAKFVAAYKSK